MPSGARTRCLECSWGKISPLLQLGWPAHMSQHVQPLESIISASSELHAFLHQIRATQPLSRDSQGISPPPTSPRPAQAFRGPLCTASFPFCSTLQIPARHSPQLGGTTVVCVALARYSAVRTRPCKQRARHSWVSPAQLSLSSDHGLRLHAVQCLKAVASHTFLPTFMVLAGRQVRYQLLP